MYLNDIDFSLWADFIERDFLAGKFKELIASGTVNGATSNPAIFKNAFLNSSAYEAQKKELGLKGKPLYEALAITDIRTAADILRPLYDKGDDGFVSIEVDPFFCDDTAATIEEGMSLYKAIDRPNVMIKVPATNAGYEAMRTLLSKGIHVNATLVFSYGQAKKILDAYKAANAPEGTKLVISVFISRFDRLLDDRLPDDLKGMAGVLNASKIYNLVEKAGHKDVKTLFASTGVKSPYYAPSYYVDELIGANAINTAPIETIDAFVANGEKSPVLPRDDAKIDQFFMVLNSRGINFQGVCDELLEDGLLQFKDAFKAIIKALEA